MKVRAALAGLEPAENWPQRTAALMWRAVGGDPDNVTPWKLP